MKLSAVLAVTTISALGAMWWPAAAVVSGDSSDNYGQGPSCAQANRFCKESGFNRRLWPNRYIGHDEPGVAFLSNHAGAGNQMEYHFTLPADPSPSKPMTRAYNFELGGAFWFGMILCDTQSYPEQVKTCKADSNSNITSLQKHPGEAYMEMQFYPPGGVDWPSGSSCGATVWCAALNVDSLSQNPETNQNLNDSCSAAAGGPEYVNFAFVTRNGKSQAPANPIQSPNFSGPAFSPNAKKDLFMNTGDKIDLKMFDTASGLKIAIDDLTSGQGGSMTASAANGFGQILYVPNPSVECTLIPYNFHPMYSTASSKTVLNWGATQDNVEFVDEIGHFDWCTGGSSSISAGGNCPSDGFEGPNANRASDYDDTVCFPAKSSSLVKINGCTGSNDPGFDGASYVDDWPNGDTVHRPAPTTFSSPMSGPTYSDTYQHAVLETDLPAIESPVQCDINTGIGCGLIPLTDAATPAAFYPFFSTIPSGKTCLWNIGTDIPGVTTQDFGKNTQFGSITAYRSLKPGANGKSYLQYTAFRHVLSTDPCAP